MNESTSQMKGLDDLKSNLNTNTNEYLLEIVVLKVQYSRLLLLWTLDTMKTPV